MSLRNGQQLLLVSLSTLLPALSAPAEDMGAESGADRELQARWEFYLPIEPPSADDNPLLDVILGPELFSKARIDLGDLRVYDSANQPVPYALRILRPADRRDPFPAEEFNRAEGQGNSTELTLDLKTVDIEHNEVEIEISGENFRREVEVEGSDDGVTWRTLVSTVLIRFRRGSEQIEGTTVTYPPSRFRFVRVRVTADPLVDDSRVNIASVSVVRKVESPGEMLMLDAKLGPRQAVRADGGPGSAWIVELGGDNVPCDRIEVVIGDRQFARNFHVEAGGPADSQDWFNHVSPTGNNMWRRRAGEETKPMVATFNEVRASRIKLVVMDYSNSPLDIRSVKFSAPARQVVFARPKQTDEELRLFFGNPEAESPNYDFARNLPARLKPAPSRTQLGSRTMNPSFVPPPQPLTERWPWLIYVVLASVSLVLAVIFFNLARAALERYDRHDSAAVS